MSRTMIFLAGTGARLGVAGVKAAKLYTEQDQIGKRLSTASMRLPGWSLEGYSNVSPRRIFASQVFLAKTCQTESGLPAEQCQLWGPFI